MISHVYYINCDCGSGYDDRRQPVRENCLPRCRDCHKQLGFMEAEYIGRFDGVDRKAVIDKAKVAHRKRVNAWVAERQAERDAAEVRKDD